MATLPDPICRFLALTFCREEGRNAQSYSHARPGWKKIVAERDQLSHGRLIHGFPCSPADGACSPEEQTQNAH